MTKKEREQRDLAKLAEMKVREDELRQQGYRYIAGIDEVGRGPLAGPVYAACVILPEDFDVPGVNDSKKLSAKRREELSEIIKDRAVAYGIGTADNREIDTVNILEATKNAMRRAILACRDMLRERGLIGNAGGAHGPDMLLIDAVKLDAGLPSESIIKGDEKCLCIAAASIVAKVARDSYMTEMDSVYPGYDFAGNKGYGTAKHYEGLRALGRTPIHRQSFLRKFDQDQSTKHRSAKPSAVSEAAFVDASGDASDEKDVAAGGSCGVVKPEAGDPCGVVKPEAGDPCGVNKTAAEDIDYEMKAESGEINRNAFENERDIREMAKGKKVYAVKKGRTTGIFLTWDDCRAQVDGFAGAEYKSFADPADAMAYLGLAAGADGAGQEKLPEGVRAYVDGSYDAANGRFSCGVVMVETDADGNSETSELKAAFDDAEAAKQRNVAGEIMGSKLAIDYCLANDIRSVEIYHDYEGIGAWADCRWKANNPLTQGYRDYVAEARKTIDIRFVKVKAHAGNKYNELADKLAKAALE